MVKKKELINSKIIGFAYLLAVLLIFAYLVFNDKGILKYLEVRERVTKLEDRIDSSENRINKIQAEIDSLKSDRFKKEKTAREKYNMKRPREKGLDVRIK